LPVGARRPFLAKSQALALVFIPRGILVATPKKLWFLNALSLIDGYAMSCANIVDSAEKDLGFSSVPELNFAS